MAVSFHKRPGRGRSSAGQVRRYQPAGQDAAQVRPHGHRSGQPHRRVAAPTPGGGRGTAGCGHPALRKHHWWCPATSGNPSVTAAPCQLPLHKGAFGTGDADCRVGPAGLLAMTSVFCHSEERSDVGIRPFYDGRGFGPPYLGHGLRRPNSVPKFGASVKSSAPTEGLPKPWAAAPTGASQAVRRNAGRDRDSSLCARKPRPGAQGGNQKKGGLASPLSVILPSHSSRDSGACAAHQPDCRPAGRNRRGI